MIEGIQQATGYGIRQSCATLEVPRSSFYHAAEPTATASQDRTIGDRLEVIFQRHRRRSGDRRIGEELSDEGVVCAPDRIRRIMRARHLHAIQPKTDVPTTSDGRADKPSPNLLLEQPMPAKPDQVWAGDITFIPTSAGWLYLAVVIDLCSRQIVGWSLGGHLRTELVVEALQQALGSRRTLPGLIFHSDRGSQDGSGTYRDLLRQAGLRQSRSARANPYHTIFHK